jgi:hypothetical protein
VPHLPKPLLDVLQQALEAHRYALGLDQQNPDTLFNTAQVLTAISEASAQDATGGDRDALQPLQEALELQSRCLSIQELKLDEYLQQEQEAALQTNSESQEIPIFPNGPDRTGDEPEGQAMNDMEDQWFSVVEPVTKNTLIDTILAQLGTLTTLCSVLSSSEVSGPGSSLAWIEEYSSKLIQTKLPALLGDADSEKLQEVALARANFVSELLKAGYLLNSLDPDTYKRERDEEFRKPELDLERNFSALTANANSLIAFNTALADGNPSYAISHAASRWSALSAAIANMASAAKLSDLLPENIAETHFVRGNCSLLQFQMGLPPLSHIPAVTNRKQLLKNADTFYRNASKLYQDNEQKRVAQFRSVVVQALEAGTDILVAASQHSPKLSEEWIEDQLSDMLDDGLISPLP